MTLVTVLVVALFLRLGFWQVARAEEKKRMLSQHADSVGKSPCVWRPGDRLPKLYQAVQVTGQYLPERFLLDNQYYQHQLGYNVLSPLQLDNGVVVLVDRGWLVGFMPRDQFPAYSTPSDRQTIIGEVWYPSNKNWVLGPVVEKKASDLTLVERLDTSTISQILQKSVVPFIIRLSKQQPHGFGREWVIVSMPPARHVAYAFQWFALALTVFIVYIALNLKKKI